MVQQLLLLFCLNCISTSLGTLKTIFLSNRIITPVYITTFLDAVIVAYAFRLMATSGSFSYIIVFALGRIAGVFLGDLIEGKLALGLLEVTVYKHPEDGKKIADELRSSGYSVTTEIGYGIEGKSRLVLNIIVSRKDFPVLKQILTNHGRVNMVVKPVAKVSGKIGVKKIPDFQRLTTKPLLR